jgi:hypothetical protein
MPKQGNAHSMESPVAAAFAGLFLGVGLVLLVYRLLYMCCQGQPWNNPPTTLPWMATLFLGGLALLIFLLLGSRKCRNGCKPDISNDLLLTYLALAVAMLVVPAVQAALTCAQWLYADTKRPARDPHRLQSGFDFACLLVGAMVVLGEWVTGRCPKAC